MDKDKEFIKWLETQDFFTKFANEHPTWSCGIVIRHYSKYNPGHIPVEGEDKTWDEVYSDWKRDIRDKKLNKIVNEEK